MTFRRFSNIIYGIAGIVLFLTAFALVGRAVWDVFTAFGTSHVEMHLLRAIGILVISIAVFDVAKYLFEEEIVRDRELRAADEARKSLTKFMVIIIIALTLEGLVFIFITGQNNIQSLLYPAGLLVTAGLLMVSIGVYQRLSLESERRDRATKNTGTKY